MLRSALAAVRSAALHPEYCRQLKLVQLSPFFGSQFRCYTAQSTPNSNSSEQSSKTEASEQRESSEPEKKAGESTKESKESEQDRLLKEKETLLKDLQVCDIDVSNLSLAYIS